MHAETELLVLDSIQQILDKNPNATQRDFAREINLSLGMTNLLLKRFSEKGWMIMKKISSRHIIYMLSPVGMKELSKRTYRYMRNTVQHAAGYKDQFIEYFEAARSRGCTKVLLVGESDVQFIIEYACKKLELDFASCTPPELSDCGTNTLVLYADSVEQEKTRTADSVQSVAVYDVLAG